jgi:hypothetical protein
MSKEYLDASNAFRAIAITAEKVAHRLTMEHSREGMTTLSVLAALGLEERDTMDKALDRMIDEGGSYKSCANPENLNQVIAEALAPFMPKGE